MKTEKLKAYIQKIKENNYEVFDAEPYACLDKIETLISEISEG